MTLTLNFMGARQIRERKKEIFSYVGLALTAFVVGIFIIAKVDQPGGPVVEVIGIIQSTGYIETDGPPRHVASIKLINGDVVQADIYPGIYVVAGNAARVNVYTRIISRVKAYKIERADTPNKI